MSAKASVRRASASSLALLLALAGALAEGVSAQQGGGIPWPSQSGGTNQPGSAPSQSRGSLAIKVVQGTPGEPAIGVIAVAVDLFNRGMLVDTITTQTDEHGVVILEDLPIGMPVRPLVKVKYEELDYQIGGGPLDAQHPQQDIEVVVYASSEEPPPWKVQTRHLMVVPEADGVRVTEVMMVVNPAHKTWVGVMGSGPKRTTTAFVLPANARDVQLGRGFHKWCCSTIVGDKLVNHLPLMPEVSEMMFSYLVPAKDGTVTLDITAPATVDSTMVMTPTALQSGVLQGLSFGGEQSMGDSNARVYSAGAMPSGGRASISFANLAPMMVATATPAADGGSAASSTPTAVPATTDDGGRGAKLVAAIGGGALLLVAIVVLLRRSAQHRASFGTHS